VNFVHNLKHILIVIFELRTWDLLSFFFLGCEVARNEKGYQMLRLLVEALEKLRVREQEK